MLKLKKIPVKKSDYPKMLDEGIPYYNPSFSLNDKQVPEIADWEVGEEYQIVVNVKMTRKEEYKDNNVSGGFDITGYKVVDNSLDDTDLEEIDGLIGRK